MSEINQYYEILQLKPGASSEAIKQAYRTLVKQWHPDSFSDPQQKQRAEAELKRINTAYEQLKQHQPNEPESTPTSNHSPSSKAPNTPDVPVKSPLKTKIYAKGTSSAEAFYNAGAENAKNGNYPEAIENFSSAIRVNPQYAEAYRYRGFIYSLMGLELGAEADLKKAEALGLKRKKRTGSRYRSR